MRANGGYGRSAPGEGTLGTQPHLRPRIAPRPVTPRACPQRGQMRIHRPTPSNRQTPTRPPHPGEGQHQVTTTALCQKRDGGMALTQPHLNAIAEGDTLRLPAGAVNADHTDRLLGGNLTSLVQRRQIRRRHRQPVCQPNSALRVTRSHTSIPNTKRHSPTPPTGAPGIDPLSWTTVVGGPAPGEQSRCRVRIHRSFGPRRSAWLAAGSIRSVRPRLVWGSRRVAFVAGLTKAMSKVAVRRA